MIPILARRHRVIAMDFIGFGRSDKFTDRQEHSYALHQNILAGFLDRLALNRITLVSVDWGAVLGAGMATERPELFERLVIMNTMLPTGDKPLGLMFNLWRQFVDLAHDVPISMVVRMGVGHGYKISDREIEGYEAPFPDASYKAALVEMPLSLPVNVDDPGAAEIRRTHDALSRWSKPAFVIFSDEDILFSKEYRFFQTLIPSAGKQPKTIIEGAGHFLVEEKGEQIAAHILSFIERTPIDTR
jgi:haloalkane dehalogenase